MGCAFFGRSDRMRVPSSLMVMYAKIWHAIWGDRHLTWNHKVTTRLTCSRVAVVCLLSSSLSVDIDVMQSL
jgi:hypothetical protein